MIRTNLKIDIEKVIISFVFFSISIIVFFIPNLISNLDFREWSQWFSILVLIIFIIQVVVFRLSGMRFVSVFSIISLFSYLFQFGATICYAIGFERHLWDLRISYYTSYRAYIRGNNIALACIIGFTFGGLLINSIKNTLDIHIEKSNKISTSIYYFKFLGYMLIVICLPFFLYTYYYSFNVIISNGSYVALAEKRLPGYITSLGKFVYIGLMILVYYYYETKRTALYILFNLFILIFLVLQMMSGVRSEPMTILFAYLIFYFQCIRKKVKIKNIVILFLLCYILANLLYSIQVSRQSGFNTQDIIVKFLTNGFNVILLEFSEFGGSSLTTAVVTNRIVQFHPVWFFLKEILNLSPIPINSKYTIVASVASGVPELGTTFVGELFYYFGFFCPIASFFIAIYIVKMEKHIYSLVKRGNYLMFFMCIMWMWQELNCIRASYNLAIKTLVYSFLLFSFIRFFYNMLKRI